MLPDKLEAKGPVAGAEDIWRTDPRAVLTCERSGVRITVCPSGVGPCVTYSILKQQAAFTNPRCFIVMTGVDATAIDVMVAAERDAGLWYRAALKCAEWELAEFF
jgi:hypothetical protein